MVSVRVLYVDDWAETDIDGADQCNAELRNLSLGYLVMVVIVLE